jgi:hypothetical protein
LAVGVRVIRDEAAAIPYFDAGAGCNVANVDVGDVATCQGIAANTRNTDVGRCMGLDGDHGRAAYDITVQVERGCLCRDDAPRVVGHRNAVDHCLRGDKVGDEAESEENGENKNGLFHTLIDLNLNLKTEGKVGRLHGVNRNIKAAFCRSIPWLG